jgi:hypothetical protein
MAQKISYTALIIVLYCFNYNVFSQPLENITVLVGTGWDGVTRGVPLIGFQKKYEQNNSNGFLFKKIIEIEEQIKNDNRHPNFSQNYTDKVGRYNTNLKDKVNWNIGIKLHRKRSYFEIDVLYRSFNLYRKIYSAYIPDLRVYFPSPKFGPSLYFTFLDKRRNLQIPLVLGYNLIYRNNFTFSVESFYQFKRSSNDISYSYADFKNNWIRNNEYETIFNHAIGLGFSIEKRYSNNLSLFLNTRLYSDLVTNYVFEQGYSTSFGVGYTVKTKNWNKNEKNNE